MLTVRVKVFITWWSWSMMTAPRSSRQRVRLRAGSLLTARQVAVLL